MRIWQLCPLGPTGYGDSPYQCFSAFAGNPYFIDLAPFLEDGLLLDAEYESLRCLPRDHVDYGTLYQIFWPIMLEVYTRFEKSGAKSFRDYGPLSQFTKAQSHWLPDYVQFMGLKAHFDGKCWLEWPATYRNIEKARAAGMPADAQHLADAHVFFQYVFYAQLAKLREYAGTHGVEIMGDVPIFVAMDSADVWSHPELFQLNKDFSPKAVAGVPPDYFSADGQLWGNPLYEWSVHQESGFGWWLERIRSNLEFYDIVRLDHFRGFESYWSVPAKDTTARNGKWIHAPGLELFSEIRSEFPEAKLVAEDLGEITDDVRALLESTGLPGMAVLQFAFGDDADNAYLPHNYNRNCVTYTGTHDNDTSHGWYRQVDAMTQDHVRRYLGISGDHISWDLIRAAIKSSAHLAVIPLQDLMSLGSEGRLNTPGAAMGNWQWRYMGDQLEQLIQDSAHYIRELIALYGR